MAQAHPHPESMFPLPRILRRINGLAHFPHLSDAESFLEEALHDPVIQELMAAEHLLEEDVRHAIERLQPDLVRH